VSCHVALQRFLDQAVPFPRRGPFLLRFPRFIGTMRRRDVRRPSRAYLNTSTQYHRCVCVRSDVPDAGTWPGAFGTGCPSSPGCRWETTDSLKFLGDPLVLLPCSSTPAGLETSGPYDVPSMAPAVSTTKAPTITADFGAGSHGFGTRCLRLGRRDYSRQTQDSLPLLARLCGVGLTPTGPLSKGFRYASCIASSFPKLTLTQRHCHQGAISSAREWFPGLAPKRFGQSTAATPRGSVGGRRCHK
jgi:hypothetical protein